MVMRGWAAMLAAVAVVGMGGAFGQDYSSSEANAAVAAGSYEDASVDRIQSMKGKATVQIYGGANVAAYGRWAEGWGHMPTDAVGAPDRTTRREIRSTAFETDSAFLGFRVNANENMWLTIKLDLDDAWDANADGNNAGKLDQDDFLEEIYFTFNNIACTGLGVKVGKMEIPFGYDKDDLLIHPYLHGTRDGAFNSYVNGMNPYNNNTTIRSGVVSPLDGGPYAEAHSVEYDNYFAVTPYYDMFNGKLKLEASLFQSKRDVNNTRHSNDDMFLRSGALRVTWRPIENLMIQGSLLARYNDASDNRKNGVAVAENGVNYVKYGETGYMFASSLAADYTFKLFCRDFNVFAEWQHSWNPYNDAANRDDGNGRTFWRDSSADDIHAGIGYQWNDKIKINVQGEWLRQRNGKFAYARNAAGNVLSADADFDMYRALLAIEYKLAAGLTMESGVQREWLNLDNAKTFYGPNTKDSFGATTWYSGIKYAF